MPMPRPKKSTFTAKQPYSRMDNREIVFRGKAVVNAARETSEFSHAPVDLNKLDSDLDSLLQLDTDAMDGSKLVRAARDEMREEVIPQMRLLSGYIEKACKRNPALSAASTLEQAYATRQTTQHRSEWIRRIEHGDISGRVRVFINADPNAYNYQLRYGVSADGEVQGEWTVLLVTGVKSAFIVDDLKPGTVYAFQVRRALKDGYSEWSHSLLFICT